MTASELIKQLQDKIDEYQHDFDIIANINGCPITFWDISLDEPYKLSLNFT